MFNVGAQLRKTRKKANLTLDQLAASSGVDRGTISRIELGHVSPRIDTISFLCEAMNTTVSSFFDSSEGFWVSDGAALLPTAAPKVAETIPANAPETPAAARNGFLFPLGGDQPKPAMEGYWPVPSSFWRGLLEVLERFEILVKNSHEMIMVQDRAGTILYASPPSEQMLGLRPQELVGRKVQEILHPRDLARYLETFASLDRLSGISLSLEYRLQHKNGSWCWMSSKLTSQLENPSIRAVVVNALLIQAPEPSK